MSWQDFSPHHYCSPLKDNIFHMEGSVLSRLGILNKRFFSETVHIHSTLLYSTQPIIE